VIDSNPKDAAPDGPFVVVSRILSRVSRSSATRILFYESVWGEMEWIVEKVDQARPAL